VTPRAPSEPGSGWPCLRAEADGVRLQIAAVPGARRTGADGLHDGALRVRLQAPPVDGKANEALLAWLARELGLPRRALQLQRGAASRRKEVLVAASAAQVEAWLARAVPDAGRPG
jgi:hypothetical protein